MSTLNPSIPVHPAAEPPAHGTNYLNHTRGFASWAFTLDHKRIGIMYLVGVLAAFGLGGLFAIMVRTELITPGPTFSNNPTTAWDFYNHMFTLHGAVMVFLFIIPAIPGALGNFVLPLMMGAKDVAFPRLNLMSFWLWVIGAVFFTYILLGGVTKSLLIGMFGMDLSPGGPNWLLSALIPSGLDTGWTFYTPYSTTTDSGVIPATMGAFILGFSSILTGVNFIATVHTLRPKGMTWFKLPLFVWALYSTAIIQILATPVLGITLLLLIAERALGVGIFDPKLGGDPVLYQHFFWFYSHPAVYIMILPPLGIISEMIAVYSRRHMFGYKFIALSSVAIALLGFLVWGHHMFVSGQSTVANAIFSAITFFIAIPSAIKVFNWMATLYGGSIRLRTPMLYALGFIGLFTIGGLTGLPLAAISTDVHLSDTYFVIAHFHYVAVGSTLFAFLAGIYHWFPKMFGKLYNDRQGQFWAIWVFVGFNITFFPQFIAGTHGMPRRYASYPDSYQIYHVISSLGAYMMGLGLLGVLWTWVDALRNGATAPANPYGGNTLEWMTPSPPPHDNFATTPEAADPYEMERWKQVKDEEWVLDENYDREAHAHHH
ncbi:MAG TPA: cbb3-type cytochrome c oxidase subunit I [Tepidisphaeraceae bacterium]|jgi:cytochrome c oxidase subunit 1